MRAVVDEQREKARWQREKSHLSQSLSLSLILVGWKRVRLWGWGKK